MVQQTGTPGWKPLGQYSEFADVLGVPPPAADGTPPSPAAAPGSPAATLANTSQGGTDGCARIRAEQAVNGPAIALIVTAGLGIAVGLLGLILTLAKMDTTQEMPGLDPEFVRYFRMFAYGPIGISLKILGIAVSVFILYGALRMQKLTNYGLVMTAAIIAMIPCFSPCCLLGLPFGIWALIVLSKTEVKSQFN
jgi:hypothetical protein